ncbi:MAG TPA: (2Fe-2S)-binding protein [Ramlibacter sp.]|jgi:aerobic-type carbon monoxide dehydrogenase small subunit (CoxS/CutS family)|nr:(2Fe-2S)-binding protein [Ramlibacter sp.]
MKIELEVNGQRHALDVDPGRSLLDVLREELGLTGTKYGCGESECGACTVLLDGRAVHACVTPVSRAVNLPITTIEGLERDGRLHPVQQAFLDDDALQCGYCTAGMIMAGVSLLAATPHPSRDAITRAMEGNVCRCGTYPRIVAAIERAASGKVGGA